MTAVSLTLPSAARIEVDEKLICEVQRNEDPYSMQNGGIMEEITIKDIAKKCGVGVSTVSRAINTHPNINPDTRAHILKVIQETGYVPNNSARNLKRTDAKCIAVLMKGVANPLFAEAVAVIEEVLKEEKYALVLQHVEAYENELDVAFELIKEKRLRGIIFLGGAFYHDREELARLNVPFVFYTIIGEEEPFLRKHMNL